MYVIGLATALPDVRRVSIYASGRLRKSTSVSLMGRYLVTWSNAEGVQETTFDDYNEAIEFIADVDGNVRFTSYADPDDAREEQWYDEQ